jgi:hypothetical protein
MDEVLGKLIDESSNCLGCPTGGARHANLLCSTWGAFRASLSSGAFTKVSWSVFWGWTEILDQDSKAFCLRGFGLGERFSCTK